MNPTSSTQRSQSNHLEIATAGGIEHLKPPLALNVSASVMVHIRPQWVWHRLSDPRYWAGFLTHLTAVTQSGLDIDEYTWSILGGTCPIRFTVREPPLHLAWQSQLGDDENALQLSGEIILEPRDWFTHLTVRLNYLTRDHQLHTALKQLEIELQHDLKRIAAVLERPVCEPS